MKFVVFVHGDQRTEAGQMPSQAEIEEMGRFNEQLHAAGMMLAGEGLHSTARAARIDYSADDAVITDGPFTEAKEIVAGFWILQAKSIDEVKEWMRKAPFRDGSIEIREVIAEEDFGEEFTPEHRERMAEMRREIIEQQAADPPA